MKKYNYLVAYGINTLKLVNCANGKVEHNNDSVMNDTKMLNISEITYQDEQYLIVFVDNAFRLVNIEKFINSDIGDKEKDNDNVNEDINQSLSENSFENNFGNIIELEEGETIQQVIQYSDNKIALFVRKKIFTFDMKNKALDDEDPIETNVTYSNNEGVLDIKHLGNGIVCFMYKDVFYYYNLNNRKKLRSMKMLKKFTLMIRKMCFYLEKFKKDLLLPSIILEMKQLNKILLFKKMLERYGDIWKMIKWFMRLERNIFIYLIIMM